MADTLLDPSVLSDLDRLLCAVRRRYRQYHWHCLYLQVDALRQARSAEHLIGSAKSWLEALEESIRRDQQTRNSVA